METGCFFSVSGYEPRPWVAEVADEVGVRLNVYNIPQKFTASLKLDPERTEKEKDLFFVLDIRLFPYSRTALCSDWPIKKV